MKAASSRCGFFSPVPPSICRPHCRQAIENIAREFERIYFLPSVGEPVSADLRARLARGDYNRIGDSHKLAQLLSKHIDAICKESHTEVAYFEEEQLADRPSVDPAAARQRAAQRKARMAAANFGFAAPQRLGGNIALIRFDGFERAVDAGPFSRQRLSKQNCLDPSSSMQKP